MKKIFFYSLLMVTLQSVAQTKLVTKTGKITFEASVPAFEEVKAKNESVTCILNPATGEIASLALMKGFRFKVALMEEHFNENYVESDKYPKATFKGKIDGFDLSKLTATAKDYTIKGKLELHGKTKDITITAKIKKTDAGVEIDSNFTVNTDDFDIEIPSVVSKKLTKKVAVNLDFTLK
ncbi:YceI family protein [Flavobacterium sp. J49]|uniref:YceI family protein n=1 Tax=Flavobacterium sp. J49 TaxID=2718534 RepID=UPI0015945452|nr:YceI family protein [Flavobacterium sp. J49]MBF6642294.1 YceI family protein [Flavobacterium sp. J49]NIC03540.1 YceI family protein [Flavobacterium sp. J49]